MLIDALRAIRLHRTRTAVVLAALFAPVTLGSLSAETTAPPPDVIAFVFLETDKNGNGVIDKDEFLRDMVQNFQDADTDHDGYIVETEAGAKVVASQVSEDPSNTVGQKDLEEVLEERLRDFTAADTDGSGTLSLEELTAIATK